MKHGGDKFIAAFSEDQVAFLTELSKSQLRYWDRTGFFCPQYAYADRRSPYSRIYSFRDVVGLRTLAILRRKHGVSLQHLRLVANKLSHLRDALWADTKLYVLNKYVLFREPVTGNIRGAVDGQYVMVLLDQIISDVSENVVRLRERREEQFGKVERHRHVARNAWSSRERESPSKQLLNSRMQVIRRSRLFASIQI